MADEKKKSKLSFTSLGKAAEAAGAEVVSDEQSASTAKPVTVGPTMGLHGEAAKEKQQQLYLDLPVSRKRILCSHAYLDPSTCFASPLNKRIQSLLTPENAEIIKLRESIETEGQRDPILVRPVIQDGAVTRYEVIYGTRRRYVMSLLALVAHEPMKLRAWVSTEIPDIDAKRLANSENDDRAPISSWETAQYIKSQLMTKKSGAVVADEIGLSESTVSRYLAIADLPESVVAVFESPSQVTLKAGAQIAAVLKKCDAAQLTATLQFFAGKKITTPSEFLKALKACVEPVSGIKMTARERLEWKSKTGTGSFSIARNQKVKHAFTAKLEGVSDEALAKIMDAIKQTLS